MEIATFDNHCIITPLSPKLNSYEVSRLTKEISYGDNIVGIDMSNVKDCTIEFLNELRNFKNVSLFNVASDIFALITLMNLDKVLNIYVSELDFLLGSRRILKRNLTVLGN